MIQLILGDCLQKLTELADNSVDSIVTDPPYGLSFMGKSWDYDVPSQSIWAECLRVLKPGGHLLAFFGTRTYHRGVIRIEDAGFEIRDMITWNYGSGFPKSTNVLKSGLKQGLFCDCKNRTDLHSLRKEVSSDGEERQLHYGASPSDGSASGSHVDSDRSGSSQGSQHSEQLNRESGIISQQSSPQTCGSCGKQTCDPGLGTALKPACEPIVVARKPLEKGLTVAQNVLKWGTGALNIDGSRIALQDGEVTHGSGANMSNKVYGEYKDVQLGKPNVTSTQGRWPANIMFDEEAAAVLDEQAPRTGGRWGKNTVSDSNSIFGVGGGYGVSEASIGDVGGASRFFYVAKVSKKERGEGNVHPTVKPQKLMSHLINLVTPPNGIVLDPFMGSGSTGVAAKLLGFGFIGIEREPQYFEIAQKRIEGS